MRIIGPTPCSTDFGPVEFEPRCHDDVFTVTAAGREVAELTPLILPGDGMIEVDPTSGLAVEPTGSWSLTLNEPEGEITRTYILFAYPENGGGQAELTGELAVWATLALIWEREETAPRRG